MLKLTEKLSKWLRHDTDSPKTEVLGLKPLHPENGQPGHDVYVSELKDAVTKDSIRNIALTGSYGSGKSSILSDFARDIDAGKKKRIIQISLAALGDQAEPANGGPSKSEEDQSNLIQKEIVKQLLFKEDPQIVPASKFKRINAPHKVRIFLYSALVAISATAVVYLLWGTRFLYPLAGTRVAQVCVGIGLLLLTFSLGALLLFSLHDRFVISKLAGGPVSLTISNNNNYFDQYLDELIYFFQVTNYDTVIFEDIERFDNAYIFVALKQLNSLLNDAGQIIATKKRIRFIYAIKDSLFSKGKFAPYEQNTNRAKFFDLIVSVVPFVTHQSSNDIMSRMFKVANIKISEELIATVSKYITDMRLIKNIYNEYLIFAKGILGEDKLEGLTASKLFAMIVYKNTNLEDFEDIKLGKSKLDKVYAEYRQTISKNIATLRNEIAICAAKLEQPQSLAARSETYGERLSSFVRVVIAANQFSNVTYGLLGTTYTDDQLKSAGFWEAASRMGQDDHLTVNYSFIVRRYGVNETRDMLIDRDMLEEVIRDSLDTGNLEDDDRERLKQERTRLQKEAREMPYKTLKEILNLNSSDQFRSKVREIIGKKAGEDLLVYDLLKADYIDSNFTLYTSIFHGTNPKAVNFLIHHLQTNKSDFHYKFKSEKVSADDNIKALLDGAGGGYIRSKSIYNIDILDYLLRKAKKRTLPNEAYHKLHHITENLSQGEPDDAAFIEEYIRSGENVVKLIRMLSAKWPEIFEYLITNHLSTSERLRLFSAALEGASKEIQYLVGESVVTFMTENAQHLDALTKPLEGEAATNMGDILPKFNMKLTSLKKLRNDIKDIVVANNLYAITLQNLEDATGLKNLSLDNIQATSEIVFNYVISNVGDYLTAIGDSKKTEHTIENSGAFPSIVDAITEHDKDNLLSVLDARSNACSIEDLRSVLPEAWPALLDARAVNPISSNIIAYYGQNEAGTLDQHLIDYLVNEGHIVANSNDTEEDLQKLAVSILSETQITTRARSILVGGLKLKRWIAVDAFPVQNGDLYGHLLDKNIIKDSASTYSYLKSATPETRQVYMSKSRHFGEYINEVVLDSDEVDIIATSAEIAPEAKRYVINNLTALDPRPSNSAVQALANFAVEDDISLDVATLYMMIEVADATTSVRLINQSNDSFTKDGMTQMLTTIGLDYARLVQMGKHVVLDDAPYNRRLAERLNGLGMVSSISEKGNRIKVNTRKGW